jgi:uncharacterized membrane protein HdeD (DUF308 family)
MSVRQGRKEGTMETLSRNWGWVVLRGVAAILFGAFALFQPGITLAALVLVFGAYAFADGVSMLVWSIAGRSGDSRWVALLVGGLFGIGIGLVTFFRPGVTAVALLVTIAVWAIAIGVATIAAAIQLRKQITGEWKLILSGLLSVALGLVLLGAPKAGALAMVLWIGAYAVVGGVLLIALGFQLRSWGRQPAKGMQSHAV